MLKSPLLIEGDFRGKVHAKRYWKASTVYYCVFIRIRPKSPWSADFHPAVCLAQVILLASQAV